MIKSLIIPVLLILGAAAIDGRKLLKSNRATKGVAGVFVVLAVGMWFLHDLSMRNHWPSPAAMLEQVFKFLDPF